MKLLDSIRKIFSRKEENEFSYIRYISRRISKLEQTTNDRIFDCSVTWYIFDKIKAEMEAAKTFGEPLKKSSHDHIILHTQGSYVMITRFQNKDIEIKARNQDNT